MRGQQTWGVAPGSVKEARGITGVVSVRVIQQESCNGAKGALTATCQAVGIGTGSTGRKIHPCSIRGDLISRQADSTHVV